MWNLKIFSRILTSLLFLAATAALFFSCGGGDKTDGGKTGSVALYLTDNMADFQQVNATINSVRIWNTGTGASCDILTEQMNVNIAELANILQLVSVADCPAADYNRLHIEFAQTVQLMDAQGGTSTCSFTSYRDNANRPNVLQCDPSSGVCTLDITGAVNVLANHTTPVALDFDLKNFSVMNFSDRDACSVTMKVSPIHAEGIKQCLYRRAMTGRISQLDTDARTFLLSKGNKTFTVEYSNVSGTLQPGTDTLLQRAQDDGLKVLVFGTKIDLDAHSINALAIAVKTEGSVTGLDETEQTFTLSDGKGSQMTVYYGPPAWVRGVIEVDAWVEVKLYGYDSLNDRFLAIVVEREDDASNHGKISEN